MIRAILELLITILIVIIARAILTGLMKGISNASQTDFQNRRSDPGASDRMGTSSKSQAAGELHKDPVCGTYVAESTPFRSRVASETFYYCSDACREKHSLVAR
jgi:YHS domain-containing protein